MSPRRTAESLLDEIADSALDDDYYLVRSGEPVRDRTANTVAVGLVMVLFAALVTVAALQTADDRPSRLLERGAMVTDIDSGRAELTRTQVLVDALEEEIAALDGTVVAGEAAADLEVLAGDVAVGGPGVLVVLQDAEVPATEQNLVTARDVRALLNGLWYAGAEAVAVGDQRVTSRSAVTTVDGGVQVNYRPVGSPVQVRAVGDPDALQDRLAAGVAGRYLARRTGDDGLRLDVSSSDAVDLPAAGRGADSLEHATPLEEAR